MFPFPFSFLSGAVPDVPVTQIANAEAMSFNGTDAYVKGSASLPKSLDSCLSTGERSSPNMLLCSAM